MKPSLGREPWVPPGAGQEGTCEELCRPLPSLAGCPEAQPAPGPGGQGSLPASSRWGCGMCSSHLAAAYACLLNLLVAERLRGSYLFTLLYAVASFYFEGREPRDPAVTVISLLCP